MKKILFPLIFGYQKATQLINFLYNSNILKQKMVNIPVISVGNISFGGTGKTPVVISLGEELLKNGYKPAILSRGYKGKLEKKGGIVSNKNVISCSWEEAGDEAFLIAKNLPEAGVFVGKNRIAQSFQAIKLGYNLILLDDGFQYRKLYRDLDIVIISSDEFLLREPFSSLRRANIILFPELVNNELIGKVKKINPGVFISKYYVRKIGFFDINESSFYTYEEFRNKRAIIFCGIAKPSRFLKYIKDLNIQIEKAIFFPDHFAYTEKSINKIFKKYKELSPEVLITTEKDAIKLKEYSYLPIYYLKIKTELSEDLYAHILKKIKKNECN